MNNAIDEPPAENDRRGFFSRLSSAVMAFGLAGGYGMFGALIGWFLYPARHATKSWMYVTDLASMKRGDSLNYHSPAGEQVVVTRMGDAGTADDFIALSSVCPHLGCHVHWEAEANRFFCPCHNGVFDASGKATAGPPGDAGQSLARYQLRIENGLLFIDVETQSLMSSSATS